MGASQATGSAGAVGHPSPTSGLGPSGGTPRAYPTWLIANVGDAIFDSLCPGIRFTPEDDERYQQAANAALNATSYADLYQALGICVAMAERSLKSAMNLNGDSPFDIAMRALAKARGEA